MEFIQGSLIKREKRFLAHVKLKSGKKIIAHCPNPGSMQGNALSGSLVKLVDYGSEHKKTGRKLRYRWVLVKSNKAWVCIDTSLANKIVKTALDKNELPEFEGIKFEAEISFQNSRFDFGAPVGKNFHFLEVKSVSMSDGDIAKFPDSVTTRGQKHLRELVLAVEKGHRASLLFLVCREDCKEVRAASEIDPEYARLLKLAHEKKVQILAYTMNLKKQSLGKRIPVCLNP